MSNVKNYFRQPTNVDQDDNIAVFNGSVAYDNVTTSAEKIKNVLASNNVAVFTTHGLIPISGIALLIGGTTTITMTMGAPAEGVYCEIRLLSITSDVVLVDLFPGITYDGTNNEAVFENAGDYIRLGYKSPTEWQIIENNGVELGLIP